MKTVTVYTKPNCPQCVATKRKLGNLGVIFVEQDARENLDHLKGLGHLSAPVVTITDEDGVTVSDHWSGYRPDRVAAIAAAPVQK